MKVTTKRITYKFGDVIRIKPIADVHYGATACDVNAFKRYLKDSDDKTYFIGIGDLLDSIRVTDPRYSKSDDATKGKAVLDDQVNEMAAILLPYKDKILGLGIGNHEDVITTRCSTNPTKRLCEKLGVELLGYSGLLRLIMSESGSRGRTVVIRYHHGWGGGSRTQGADLTKYSKDLAYWDADLFLYGHVHRKQTDEVPRLGLSGEKLVAKPKVMCICGTFLRTYTMGDDPTYSEIKGYPPVAVGGVMITIKPVERWVKMRAYLD